MSDTQTTIDHPGVNPETAVYWQAASEGILLIKTCTKCGTNHFYPRAQCPNCRSTKTEWKKASGAGEIYSHSTFRRSDPPLTVAYVRLDEGVSMFTNIVDCDPDQIRIGMRVTVVFRKNDDGLTLPVFTPAE